MSCCVQFVSNTQASGLHQRKSTRCHIRNNLSCLNVIIQIEATLKKNITLHEVDISMSN